MGWNKGDLLMAGKIITVAQQKGGAGKTTLAAQLGVACAAGGRKVALVDIDPQASLGTWWRERNGTDAARHSVEVVEVAGYRVGNELTRLKRAFDLVIIDSPPHAETEARLAVRAADLVLVPVQPSPMDIWATQPTIELARSARKPVMVVLNRVPPRGKVVDQMRTRLTESGVPVAATAIGNRVAFAASMLDGAGVVETAARSTAADEIRALGGEILDRL